MTPYRETLCRRLEQWGRGGVGDLPQQTCLYAQENIIDIRVLISSIDSSSNKKRHRTGIETGCPSIRVFPMKSRARSTLLQG